MVLSRDPEARSLKSGDQATLVTASVWPCSTLMHDQHSAAAHKRMVESREPDAIVVE